MAIEIERKFLVTGDFRNAVIESVNIRQGYLASAPERTVRVRIKGNRGFLTVKGKTDASGIGRFEWEKEIDNDEAEDLLNLCEPGIIEKTRHIIYAGSHTFEVDEFRGENSGLIIAEVELTSAGEAFDKPSWLGPEVTHDHRYYNAWLSKNPFRLWK
jgi:adenylate cyclase